MTSVEGTNFVPPLRARLIVICFFAKVPPYHMGARSGPRNSLHLSKNQEEVVVSGSIPYNSGATTQRGKEIGYHLLHPEQTNE